MRSSVDKHLGPEGHRERLRQRFVKSGRGAMADYELLELLLTYVIPRIDTEPLAKAPTAAPNARTRAKPVAFAVLPASRLKSATTL